MQAGAGDDDPADLHRSQLGHRGDGPGAADLKQDVVDGGDRLAGRELVGDGPARGAGLFAQFPLQGQAVDLDHHTVDFVRQLVPSLEQVGIDREYLGEAFYRPGLFRVDSQPPLAQLFQQLRMSVRQRSFEEADAVAKDLQRPAGGDRRIELAQAAGGGVAGIGEVGQALLLPRFVEGLKSGQLHVDFAPYFQ